MHKTLMIMAGGTGGHVFPGLAVAEALKAQNWNIHWLGTEARMEAQIVPQAGYPISFIDVAGVRGNGWLRKLTAPWHIIKSIWQASKVLKRVKPDLVLGMGGFASGPGGVAAWLSGIPLIIHEQNALPGMTNKLLARIATKVLTGFDKAFAKQLEGNDKYLWVGNPVRNSFAQIAAAQPLRQPMHILVVGGSLGASVLNEVVPQALSQLEQVQVFHQCGKDHVDTVNKNYQQSGLQQNQWQVEAFIEDMAKAYQWADVVICRAGALTVAEVAMAGAVAIFVPLPHAVDDHQTLNARALSDNQAAYLLPQPEFTCESLCNLLETIKQQPQQHLVMRKKVRTLAKPQATETVVMLCNQLVERAA